MTVRKAVIPVAGFGTRFLPVTRSIPKVMIPVLDRPAVHFCVAEATQAGIRQIVFVVSRNQGAVSRYFDAFPELEAHLTGRGADAQLNAMRTISSMAEVTCVLQEEQRGLGHAVLMARHEVGDEPFAVFLPDDIIWSDSPTISSMIDIHEKHSVNVLAVKQVPDSAIPSLGIIEPAPVSSREMRVLRVVEKPPLEDAPSNLAVIGRYVLVPEVFDALEMASPGALGEIQLTDAIATLIDGPGVYAYRFPGEHFDIGTPLGMLKASVHEALQRDDMRQEVVEWLAARLEAHGS